MNKITFLMKTNMKAGVGELDKLPIYLNELGYSKAGLIIDPSVREKAILAQVLEACRKGLDKCEIFAYDHKGEPSYAYLDKAAGYFRGHPDLQVIIGIGGGSVMDMAKGVALLMTNPGEGLKYRGFPTDVKDPLPMIGIPTTAGTGSETTFNAVFIDTKEGKKLGINSIKNFPVMSILDPRLIQGAPLNVIASSGMDAVVHAIESFVSRKATPITRMYSVQAYRLLAENLKKVKDSPNDLEVLGNLQIGAYLAIIALANSSSGPAGGLSYLLGTWYKVPHGTAGAFFLPAIHKFNYEHGYHDYALLSENKGQAAAGKIIDELFELNRSLGIPDKMNAFKVPASDQERFVQGCLNDIKGTFDLNPVVMNEKDIRGILKGYFE